MASFHVEVTAEHIGDVDPKVAWADPVILALEELTGMACDIDGDGETGNIAMIGSRVSAWTLVIEFPDVVNAWLNRRWDNNERGEPFGFDIEVPDWIVALLAKAASVEEQGDAVLRSEGRA